MGSAVMGIPGRTGGSPFQPGNGRAPGSPIPVMTPYGGNGGSSVPGLGGSPIDLSGYTGAGSWGNQGGGNIPNSVGNDPTFGGGGMSQRANFGSDAPQVNMPGAVGSAGAASLPHTAPMGVPGPQMAPMMNRVVQGPNGWQIAPSSGMGFPGGGLGGTPGTPGGYHPPALPTNGYPINPRNGQTIQPTNNPYPNFGGTPGAQNSTYMGQPYQRAPMGQFQYGSMRTLPNLGTGLGSLGNSMGGRTLGLF